MTSENIETLKKLISEGYQIAEKNMRMVKDKEKSDFNLTVTIKLAKRNKVKEIDAMVFSQITSALNEAETKNFTKVRIIKDRTSFNPYAPSIDDNLFDPYIRNETTLNVTQFEYDENTIDKAEKWRRGYLKDSICDNLYLNNDFILYIVMNAK